MSDVQYETSCTFHSAAWKWGTCLHRLEAPEVWDGAQGTSQLTTPTQWGKNTFWGSRERQALPSHCSFYFFIPCGMGRGRKTVIADTPDWTGGQKGWAAHRQLDETWMLSMGKFLTRLRWDHRSELQNSLALKELNWFTQLNPPAMDRDTFL